MYVWQGKPIVIAVQLFKDEFLEIPTVVHFLIPYRIVYIIHIQVCVYLVYYCISMGC